jgi:hypothetical protein
VAVAARVSVLVVVAGIGEKLAVTPGGNCPELAGAVRVTLPLNPFCALIVTVIVPCVPCSTVKLLLESESVKSPGSEPPDELPPHPTKPTASPTTEINTNPSFSRNMRPRFFPQKI